MNNEFCLETSEIGLTYTRKLNEFPNCRVECQEFKNGISRTILFSFSDPNSILNGPYRETLEKMTDFEIIRWFDDMNDFNELGN